MTDRRQVLRRADVTYEIFDMPLSDVIKTLQEFPADAELERTTEYLYGERYDGYEVQWYEDETDAEIAKRQIDGLNAKRGNLIEMQTMLRSYKLPVPQELKDELAEVRAELKNLKG